MTWLAFLGGAFVALSIREVVPFLVSEVRRELRTTRHRKDQDAEIDEWARRRKLRLVLGGAVSKPGPYAKLRSKGIA